MVEVLWELVVEDEVDVAFDEVLVGDVVLEDAEDE